MMKAELQKAFNKQVNEELYSAYLYLAMADYFVQQNLKGFARWMRAQVVEELNHANKFMAYLQERCAPVVLDVIAAPKLAVKSPLAAFEAAYKHECHISERINDLYSASLKANDNAAVIFLNWFVTEQVEEEGSVDEVVQQLKLAKDAPGALFMLDRELGARVPALTPPSQE